MDEFLTRTLNLRRDRAIKQIREEEYERGDINRAKKMAKKMYRKGYPVSDIADLSDVDEGTVQSWLAESD